MREETKTAMRRDAGASAYSDAELEAMLADLESETAERKESMGGDAPKRIREAVCAFANDLPNHRKAGVIFVGARDQDGKPAGLAVTDELLNQLADIKTDGNIVPPPSLSVEKRVLAGGEMAVITVQPSDAPPVRYKGTIYIRIGARRGIAGAQDERILNEKRRHLDGPFDALPVPGARLSDLNLRRFEEEYLPRAISPEALAANDRSLEERLAATKMIVSPDEPVPTVTGLLVLGKRPRDFFRGAYIQFLRIMGDELGAPTDAEELDGTIVDIARRVDEKLRAHNRIKVDITSGPTEKRYPDYPLPALKELVYNAILHRSYEGNNAHLQLNWFDDRIEISGPGGPFGDVTAQNFGQPGVLGYRNPNLAEAMRALGLVQRYGIGLRIARQQLAQNGQAEPQFRVDPNYVFCTVQKAKQ